MPENIQFSNLKINILSEAQYEQIASPSNTELYLVPEIVDTIPTEDSTNPITSGGVYDALQNLPSQEQSDWNETDTTDPAYIKNKPTIPSNTSDLTNNSGFITVNDVPKEIVWCTFTETDSTNHTGTMSMTIAEMQTAVNAGKVVCLKNGYSIHTLTWTGDIQPMFVCVYGVVVDFYVYMSTDQLWHFHTQELQPLLISATNIKTINGNSVLGSGDLTINALPSVTPIDNGKVLMVANGAWTSGDTDDIKAFKGWFDNSTTLETAHPAPQVGDYAYIKGASASDPAAIYECTTAGTWTDSGRNVDTSNVQTFKTSEQVNDVSIVNDLTTGGEHDVLSAEQGKLLRVQVNDINKNPAVQYVKSCEFTKYYIFDASKSSQAILSTPVILSQNGDSIQFRVWNVSYTDNSLRNAFMAMDTGSYISIGMTKEGRLTLRDTSSTWLISNSDKYDIGLDKVIKIAYENNNINIYVDGVLSKTISGLATVEIDRIGGNVHYGFYTCKLSDLEVNGQPYFLENNSSNWQQSNITVAYTGSLLTTEEKQKLYDASNLPKMFFEKTSTLCMVYIKSDDTNKYIGYPLEYRNSSFVAEEYPSFLDNWGVGRLAVYEYSNVSGVMTRIAYLFNSGEAELAIRLGDNNETAKYVGGAAHGFENIVTENSTRHIAMFFNDIKIDETATLPLTPITSFYVIQNSQLYEAYTNTNPIANVVKKWNFTEKGLSITSEVTFLSAMNIYQCQMGMFCVYRHYAGDSEESYLTNRTVKDNEPFVVYDTSDGWETGNTNASLKTLDHDCTKITQYGECGYGFSLSYTDATLKTNGGMKVGTNNAAYNKIYFDLTHQYSAEANETLKATQHWEIYKIVE